MATNDLPQMDPGGEMTHNIAPTTYITPFTDLWFTQSYVENIDHEMMGWLTAQGWQVVNVAYDSSTSPPTPYYAMAKRSMNNWIILQQLMSSLTGAFNEGRRMNYLRYRDIVTVWNHAFAQSQQHYKTMTTKSNADVVVYMTAFTNDLTAIATQIGLARSEGIAEADRAATQIDTYVSKLNEIEANFQNHFAYISELIYRQQQYLGSFLVTYLADLDKLDAEYATHTGVLDDLLSGMADDLDSHITTQLEVVDQFLTDYNDHADAIADLQTNAQATLTSHGLQVDSLLSSMLSDYNALASSVSTSLSGLNTAFGSHSSTYEGILTTLTNDFTTHATTARALLTGLGATELARINQAFDARLSEVAQNLANRGFYSSAILNDEQDRVERERNQAIVELNDRLAREKLTNEHQLFGEQDGMRARNLDGRDRLYVLKQDGLRYAAQTAQQLFGQLQGVRDRTLSARQAVYGIKEAFTRLQIDVASNLQNRLEAVRTRTMEARDRIQAMRDALSRAKLTNASQVYSELAAIRRQHIEKTVQSHAAQQDVSRNEAAQRDKLLAQVNDAVQTVLDGKAKYAALCLQKGQYLSDLRVKLNVQLMEIAARRLQAQQGTSQGELELMKYQLDSRNNFLVGMFRVIQDRSDEYPDLTEMSKLAFSLGDAGSGWVAP